MKFAISGKMRSGKDTAGAILYDYLKRAGGDPKLAAFATAPKQIADDIRNTISQHDVLCYGWVRRLVYGNYIPYFDDELVTALTAIAGNYNLYNRRWLVREVAEAVRTRHPNAWIKALENTYTFHIQEGSHPIITDLRFPQEEIWARDMGIFRIRIDIDPEIQKERLGSDYLESDIKHYGETALDKCETFTARISNNGTIGQLEERLIAICTHLRTSQVCI